MGWDRFQWDGAALGRIQGPDKGNEFFWGGGTRCLLYTSEFDEWKVRLEVCRNNNDYNDLTKVINPIMNVFTDGDLTKIPNVDWFNEHLSKMSEFGCSSYDTQSNHLFVNKNEQCGIKPRLIWDDGG